MDALDDLEEEALILVAEYASGVGDVQLVEAVQAYCQRHYDWRVEADWLVWLPGLVCGINLACRSVDGEVLTATPVYPPFLSAPGLSGRGLVRVSLREEIRALQRDLGITTVFVTHDQEEALTMSDRIAVMSQGRILQVGSPTEIYEAPVNRTVADFIGETNFLAADAFASGVRLADGQLLSAVSPTPRHHMAKCGCTIWVCCWPGPAGACWAGGACRFSSGRNSLPFW